VDSTDLEILQACVTGPEIAYAGDNLPSGCTVAKDNQAIIAADFDGDGDVDQVDFGVFQRCFSGDKMPDPTCDD
jgi:hypothetical protein